MLAEDLRLLRLRRRISQRQLAALSGLSRATINRVETRKSRPRGETVVKILRVLFVAEDPERLRRTGNA